METQLECFDSLGGLSQSEKINVCENTVVTVIEIDVSFLS